MNFLDEIILEEKIFSGNFFKGLIDDENQFPSLIIILVMKIYVANSSTFIRYPLDIPSRETHFPAPPSLLFELSSLTELSLSPLPLQAQLPLFPPASTSPSSLPSLPSMLLPSVGGKGSSILFLFDWTTGGQRELCG